MQQNGMGWDGMVWHGMAWHGMMWFDIVWYGMDGILWYGVLLGGCSMLHSNAFLSFVTWVHVCAVPN